MAEPKVEQALDEALDHTDLALAPEQTRAELARQWNADDSRLRARLLAAVEAKAETRQQRVADQLDARQRADVTRARDIFAAFRRNLHDSREHLAQEIRAEEEALFTDDQQAQRRRDLRAMEDRLASLDDEERREIAAITQRYADVKPHVSAAAVVFALTSEDAEPGGVPA